MENSMKHLLLLLFVFAGFSCFAASQPRTNILAEYKSGDSRFAEADAVLNKVRMATVNTVTALQYSEEIEHMLHTYPDYPYKAEAYYFLGLNYKIAAEYSAAKDACEMALKLNHGLEDTTPVKSFIKGAIFELRAIWYPRYAVIAILVVLLGGVLIMLKSTESPKISVRYLKFSLITVVLWAALFIGISLVNTASSVTHVADYPQPTLINTTIGTIGSAPLAGIFVFGAIGIIALLFFVFTTSTVQSVASRKIVNVSAAIIVSTSTMVLCYMQFCYRNATFIWEGKLHSSRMNILVKDLVWRNEIPDEMLELYDEGFRAKVLESRNEK